MALMGDVRVIEPESRVPTLTMRGAGSTIPSPTARTGHVPTYFSRLRRAEIGQHHHISGSYLGAYADEMAWTEDNRK
jgi:hypothetical protein